jgi:diadenosine tetraphosphatase ApaH/serine/threonine PP2A family protein phosphatase
MPLSLLQRGLILALFCVTGAVHGEAPPVAATTTVHASDVAADATLDDGPYVSFQAGGNALSVTWVCKGKTVRKVIAKAAGAVIAPVCGYAKPITIRDDKPSFPVPVTFMAKNGVALSDVHGQFDVMVDLLKRHGVIDRDLKWSFGDGHMVMIGDMFDRGPKVTEVLWFLYGLEVEARAAGGAVHVLLGNHETMVLYDDLRYINPKYAAVGKMLEASHSQLFNEQTVLGRWLRSKPLLIQVNDMLFVHGGLNPEYTALMLSLQETNEAFRESLGRARATLRDTPLASFLYGSRGPLWYRGYFREPKIDSASLDALLKQYGVGRMVVGHTTLKGVFSHFGGRVINTDADMQKGKAGELLFWSDRTLTRGTFDGERLPLNEYEAEK